MVRLLEQLTSSKSRKIQAETLETREVPSVGMEDIYSMPTIPGDSASYPTDISTLPPGSIQGDPLLGHARNRYAVGTTGNGTAILNVYDARTNALLGTITPFGISYKGSISVATGDVTGDGIQDIVVSAGRGSQPWVQVYDGSNLQMRASFLAYSKTFTGGVSLAVGDVTGDGRADVIVGAGIGSAPQVKVFSGKEIFALPGSVGNTAPKAAMNFFAFATSNRAGISVASGDLDGDGRAEIIVGTGRGAPAEVKAFNTKTNSVVMNQSIGAPGFTGGVTVAAGDITGDGKAEVIVGQASGGSQVWIYDQGSVIANYAAFSNTAGVRVAAEDVTNDGKAEVVVAVAGGTPRVRVLNGLTGAILRDFPGFVPGYTGGLTVG